MEQLAIDRAQQIKASLMPHRSASKQVAAAALSKDRHTDRDRSKFMGSLLVQMHQGDDNKTARSKASMKKQSRGTAASKANNSSKTTNSKKSSTNNNNKKKAHAVSKNKKRSKY